MSKLISISDDVYEKLKHLKGEDSYSKVIKILIEKKPNKEKLLGFFGKGGVDEKKVRELAPMWKKWSEKYV